MKLALVLLVACSGGDQRVTSSVARQGSVDEPILVPAFASPHTVAIKAVATTDTADAALTLDGDGSLRLWPTLDGKHEPVVVRTAAPTRIALGSNGALVVAAILDEAAGLEILRFDRTGNLLGRVKIAPEIDDAAVVGTDVIVLRRDQTIARFDARGTPRGHLGAPPRQRIQQLATRRGALVVGLGDKRTTSVRFVQLEATLAWGETIHLPLGLVDIALSPNRRLLAGYGATGDATVVLLKPKVMIVGTAVPAIRDLGVAEVQRGTMTPRPVVGFVDDTHALTSGPEMTWLVSKNGKWEGDRNTLYGLTATHAAIGDLGIGAMDGSIVLVDPWRDRWLGYRQVGYDGELVGRPISVHGERELFLLDERLRETRSLGAAERLALHVRGTDLDFLFAIDNRHVLLHSRAWKPVPKDHLLVYDTTSKQTFEVGTLDHALKFAYEPTTNVIALRSEHTVHRFKIDLATKGATRLRPLVSKDTFQTIHLTDPTRANGVVAAVLSYEANIIKIWSVPAERDLDGPPLEATKLKVRAGNVALVDRAANIYVAHIKDMAVYAAGSPKAKPKILKIANARHGAASSDGALLAFTIDDGDGSVAVYDASGARRWEAPVAGVHQIVFADGDRTVIARGWSGLVAFDAKTGERLAAVCAWGFGLHDRGMKDSVPNAPSNCVP